ncbi:MAG: diacylglycerol kinase family protein [Saprospiraceae bacterium]|nr:diacylglycerol kinase family protein [Saprospiraceae bacterium]
MFNKRLNSFKYAFAGLFDLIKTQPNTRFHLIATLIVITAGIFFKLSRMEWCLIVLSITIVLAAEALNTALEYLTDLVSPGYHPLAGKAKDVAAAGVLLVAFGAATVGLIIFLPKILDLF